MESHSVAGLVLPNGPLGLLGLQEPADWFDDDDGGGGDDGDCCCLWLHHARVRSFRGHTRPRVAERAEKT